MGLKVGFVPTMGFLHEGHLSLVRAARRDCDRVVVSVFVNPTQFEPHEDFERYPRDEARDHMLLEAEGVDEIWAPSVEEMYPEGVEAAEAVVPPASLISILCGMERPHHFTGVATVVKRLFEYVKPTDVYFGQKDYQQTRVVNWLLQNYFSDIRLHVLPTVREPDGLALSSRNVYLSPEGRQRAVSLSMTLQAVRAAFGAGERGVGALEKIFREKLTEAGLDFSYAEIRAQDDLSTLELVDRSAVACASVHVDSTRLIDNLLLYVGE